MVIKNFKMKKFKTIFIITLLIDIIAALPLVLFMFNPSMMDEMVFSQFPGINDAGKEGLELMHFVFGMLSLSMVSAVIIALTIKVKESAQTAALILSVIHIGWVVPDWISIVLGKQHPPIAIMLITLIPVIALLYGWKKAEI